MLRPFLLGLLILAGATSCVPRVEHAEAPTSPPAKPVKDPRQLLRKLALDVPEDVARLAHDLPASLDDAADVVPPPPVGAPAFVAQPRSEADATRASDCLTAAIYYEARSEPVDGQRAVAQVVLNRVRDRAFPSTVCGVVFQGSHRRTGCQFSFTCDGSMLRNRRDPFGWARARQIADAALAGSVYAPVGSATHYHANYVSPWWAPSLTRIGQVGAHIFYRWRGAMERALAFRQDYAGWEPDVSAGSAPAPVIADAGGEMQNGVQVHFGDRPADTVTIHRNATPAAVLVPRTVLVSGVRVHRDGPVQAPAADEDLPPIQAVDET